MNREIKKTIGTWRVQPLPAELEYASPIEAPVRTISGFGVASILLGCAIPVAVIVAAYCGDPWSSDGLKWLAGTALRLAVVGVGFGIAGGIRRSKRRLSGILGILINLCVCVAAGLLWYVARVAQP